MIQQRNQGQQGQHSPNSYLIFFSRHAKDNKNNNNNNVGLIHISDKINIKSYTAKALCGPIFSVNDFSIVYNDNNFVSEIEASKTLINKKNNNRGNNIIVCTKCLSLRVIKK